MLLDLTIRNILVNFARVAGVSCGWKPDCRGHIYKEVELRGVKFGVG